MNYFVLFTLLFMIVSVAMVLIILVQRPQGGGLAGAFGGAGGGGSDTVFGGRVGDALTWATVVAFVIYLLLAVTISLIPIGQAANPAGNTQPVVEDGGAGAGAGLDAGAADASDAAGDAENGATPVEPGLGDPIPVVPAPTTPPAPADGGE